MHTTGSESPAHVATPKSKGSTTSRHDQSTSLDAEASGRGGAQVAADPQAPHEHDESSHSQARASEDQKDIGEQAYRDTLGATTDTDRGPVLDAVYNEKIAPRR